MDVITPGDLASYVRDPSATTDPSAALFVELANGLVTDVVGNTTVTTKIRAVTLEAAARAWRNPEGYSSETVDDYTYRLPTEARRAGVFLTETEINELTQTAATSRIGWLA